MHGAALRSMRAMLEGHWDVAERTAEQVRRAGEAVAPILAAQEYGTVLMLLRSEQLRLGELTDGIEAITQLGAATCSPGAGRWPGRYTQAGRMEEARAELALLRRDHFAALPRDVNFDVGLAILAHVADELGDAELAADHRTAAASARRPVDRVRHRIGTLGPVAYRSGSATCWPVASTWRSATSRRRSPSAGACARGRTRRTPPCGWPGRSCGGARPATPNEPSTLESDRACDRARAGDAAALARRRNVDARSPQGLTGTFSGRYSRFLPKEQFPMTRKIIALWASVRRSRSPPAAPTTARPP